MNIPLELAISLAMALSGAIFTLLGLTWKFSHRFASLDQRLARVENLSCANYEDTNKELDQRLQIVETNFAHADELVKALIASNHERNKAKIYFLFATIQSIQSTIAEIKQHLVGLQTGLNRNGIAVRQEEAWLQDAKENTIPPEMDFPSFLND